MPVLVGERHRGQQRDGLDIAGHRDAAARDGLLGPPTSPIENVEAGGARGAVFLIALVGLDEEIVTIGV